MRFPALILLCAALALAAMPSSAQWRTAREPAPIDLATFPRDRVQVDTATGSQSFEVWIADTPERQRQGLMWVRDLPADHGMLFINESPRLSSFWMKNTYIPLDMLFVDARGRIVAILANVPPLSLEPVGPDVPVLGVLELRGGEAERRGIKRGNTLRHAAFGTRR